MMCIVTELNKMSTLIGFAGFLLLFYIAGEWSFAFGYYKVGRMFLEGWG